MVSLRDPRPLEHRILRALRSARCLSLDVFDTALLRKSLHPRDLYGFLEDEMVERYGPRLRGVSTARLEAERRADEIARLRGGGDEHHFLRIYEVLGEIHPSARPHLDELRERELELERSLIVRNDWCHELFQKALALGKRVFFLSDMYLPSSIIGELLRREGYEGFEALYVSAEVGRSKSDGRLFSYVLAKRGLEPSDVVHVGDSFEGDFDEPSGLGVTAFWCRAARDRVFTSPRFTHIVEDHLDGRQLSPPDCLALGLAAKEELRTQDSFAEDRETIGERLGYQVLGPLQMSFVHWITQRATALGLEDLYFLARDAWITKQVFDEVRARGMTEARSHYLHASRVSLSLSWMAGTTTEEAIRDVFEEIDFFGMKLTVGRLMVRFGLNPTDFATDVEASPLGGLNRLVDTPAARREFFRLIKRIDPTIRAMVEAHRRGYDQYLRDLGVWEAKRVGVVDNTTSGRTYLRLRSLFCQEGSANEAFCGLYTYVPPEAMRRLSPGADVDAWLYNFTDRGITERDLAFRPLYEEMMLSAPENSFERAEANGDGVKLVFHPGPSVGDYERFTRHVHSGAMRFVRDFLSSSSTLDWKPPSKALAYDALLRFCYEPTAEEAHFFRGRLVGNWAFEKEDWVDLVPVVRGWTAFEPVSVKRALDDAYWRQGYLATLPAPVKGAYQRYVGLKEGLAPLRVRLRRAMCRRKQPLFG